MRVTGSPVKSRKRVIVRFAGDSGDGMQLAGSRFTEATAEHGNDFATLPSFPAEIRAPAGTLAGVSAFQIHFASQATCRRPATRRTRSRTGRSTGTTSSASR
jgi:2-oxoglutarate ferredoxin oxidoreductase subunit alpha